MTDQSTTKAPHARAPLYERLSPREREVAKFLAIGRTCTEVAAQLGISVKTVDTHRGHIMKKLGVRNNVELARDAIRVGLTPLDEPGLQ
jgi:DNA-binding CsgD family transcriptional regulator